VPEEVPSLAPPRRRILLILLALLLLACSFTLRPLLHQARLYDTTPLRAVVVLGRNLLLGPVRVGLQVGHEQVHDHPDELAALRFNTGGHSAGIDEVDVNRAVAAELKMLLEAAGIRVDLLPATVPRDYNADLVLSLHADSSLDTDRNGFKTAHFHPARNPLEPVLKELIDSHYLPASGLADDSINTSGAMYYYYAFSRSYRHSVHPLTPALIVELGYISNASDRQFLLQSERPARLLADGVLAFLQFRQRLPVHGY
jgi:N-acetylmuramoyl-L-alanine amidase